MPSTQLRNADTHEEVATGICSVAVVKKREKDDVEPRVSTIKTKPKKPKHLKPDSQAYRERMARFYKDEIQDLLTGAIHDVCDWHFRDFEKRLKGVIMKRMQKILKDTLRRQGQWTHGMGPTWDSWDGPCCEA